MGNEAYVGEIVMFAGDFAPVGWLVCDGRELPISAYAPLFSLLGTAYGGDGRTTFALPDLRGRAPVGVGTGAKGLTARARGDKAGKETATLQVANLPAGVLISTGKGDSGVVTGKGLDVNRTIAKPQPVDTMSPVLGINFIICVHGIFPARP